MCVFNFQCESPSGGRLKISRSFGISRIIFQMPPRLFAVADLSLLLSFKETLKLTTLCCWHKRFSGFPSASRGCCALPGARPQPRLRPGQLLPGNRRPAGRSREEPEGLVHLWAEEEGALLHRQPPAGQPSSCISGLSLSVAEVHSWNGFWSCCRMKRNVSIVIRGGRMTRCTTPSTTG